MSVFSNTPGPPQRYGTYVEQFHDLFRRHGLHYGKAGDLPQLAPRLIRNDEFRVDFSMLARWMQKREDGRLSIDEMVTILGIAMNGPKTNGASASNVAPLMVFLSGLGGWNELGAARTGNAQASQTPDIFRAGANNGSVEGTVEERKAGEWSSPNALRNSGASAGFNTETPPAFSVPVENGTGWQDAGTREPENANEDRLKRIRQQLEELDGRSKNLSSQISQGAETRGYREITPKATMPATQFFREAEIPKPEDDIFRAFHADLLEKRDQGLMASVKAALTRMTGESAMSERRVRLLVAMFGSLVLLPPTVVCVLLYRDAVRIASQSPTGPFVTREHEFQVSEADPKAQMRKGRGRMAAQQRQGSKVGNGVARANDEETAPVSGLSTLLDTDQGASGQVQTAEIPVMEKGSGKIHLATPGTPPLVAEAGPGSLEGMPGNRGGAENWMSILGHMDEIDVSARTIPTLETGPAKIHYTRNESLPVIATTKTKMADGMPSAIVEMSYPVVVARADASPSVSRGTSGAPEELANVKLASVAAGGAGSIPKGGSPAKQFGLLHPSVAVSAGLLSSNIVKFQMPSYPKAAKKQRLEGDVLVRVLISEKGKIDRAVALNGPVQFKGAAEKAVRHWRYKPYVQNGQPVQVQTWVTFHFAMHPG